MKKTLKIALVAHDKRKADMVDWAVYKRITDRFNLNIKIIEGKTYDCINIADFCLVASGTATLEAAIMQKPFAVVYKMGWLNYLLYRPQVKVKFISLVNILSGRLIVPEFVQFNADPKKISSLAINLLKNPAELDKIRQNLVKLNEMLGEKGASQRAARIITDFLRDK